MPSGSDLNQQNVNVCTTHHGIPSALELTDIWCDETTRGRYVIIQIPGEQETLTLCEVQVYGECNIDKV